jgi:hypothetical protein
MYPEEKPSTTTCTAEYCIKPDAATKDIEKQIQLASLIPNEKPISDQGESH